MNLFVNSYEHPLLANLTDRFETLQATTVAAENSARDTLQAHSELIPARSGADSRKKKKTKKSPKELAKERRLKYVSAILRCHAAYNPLLEAMDAMYDLLEQIGKQMEDIRQGKLEFPDYWMVEVLYLNYTCACQLYKRAFKAVEKLGYVKSGMFYVDHGTAWELGQDCARSCRWFATVPRNPEPEASTLFKPHVPTVMLARAFSMLADFSSGGGCISIDNEIGEECAARKVVCLLKAKGWPAGVQDRTEPGMTVGLEVHSHPDLKESDDE